MGVCARDSWRKMRIASILFWLFRIYLLFRAIKCALCAMCVLCTVCTCLFCCWMMRTNGNAHNFTFHINLWIFNVAPRFHTYISFEEFLFSSFFWCSYECAAFVCVILFNLKVLCVCVCVCVMRWTENVFCHFVSVSGQSNLFNTHLNLNEHMHTGTHESLMKGKKKIQSIPFFKQTHQFGRYIIIMTQTFIHKAKIKMYKLWLMCVCALCAVRCAAGAVAQLDDWKCRAIIWAPPYRSNGEQITWKSTYIICT